MIPDDFVIFSCATYVNISTVCMYLIFNTEHGTPSF